MLPGVSAPAGSPAITGHLLATATANLAQASFGPLQPFMGLPALQPLLSALEVGTASADMAAFSISRTHGTRGPEPFDG